MIRHETTRYRLEEDPCGFFTLTRKDDGKSVFMQGDDARDMDDSMGSIEDIKAWSPSFPRGLDSAFDYLCSGYDEVMS